MHNSIILSSCLFGSVYLFSKSLELINRPFSENKKIPHELMLINSLTFGISGLVCLYTVFKGIHIITLLRIK